MLESSSETPEPTKSPPGPGTGLWLQGLDTGESGGEPKATRLCVGLGCRVCASACLCWEGFYSGCGLMPSAGSAVGRAVQGRKLPPLPSLPRSRLLFSSSSVPAHHRNRVSGPVQAGQFRSPRPGSRFRLPFGLGDGWLWAVCVARAQRPIRFDSASQRLLSLSLSLSVTQSVSACVCAP